jgi:hypothetical protein
MCLFHFSTYFEQPSAHHQGDQLYQYIIWYISLRVGGRLVCRSERNSDLHTRLHTYIHTHTYLYIGTGIFVYVFNSAFETRLDSCLHSVGRFFFLLCTYFSLPENRKKGNGSGFIKLGEEDLVLIDWISLVYVLLVRMHHFYNKLVSIAYKMFENCVLFLLQHYC